MNVALAVSRGRLAPCFPGVEIRMFRESVGKAGEATWEDAGKVSTWGWHPLVWGRELMRRDVGLLICAGLSPATWAAIRGHGIEVIPDVMGEASDVFAAWRAGRLAPPHFWPVCPGGGGGRRQRFRGGRQVNG